VQYMPQQLVVFPCEQ